MSDQESYSPKEFLKSRRPGRFSDSAFQEDQSLDRSLLEYHLETLTNRSQEKDFETFCREIIKREICPNIIPQTGPTGGGDSKVDSETYPVATSLTLSWLVGNPEDASSERWAFAFSTAEQWRRKVRKDIEKIAEVDRGYTKAFFVSSQFIRDKVRGELEDELRTRHGFDVRILDRSWLLDRVFTSNHEAVAIDSLGIQVPSKEKVDLGPEDYRRKSDLEELESDIEEKADRQRFTPQLVDDALEAAILSRQLEKPHHEVNGYFERAERIARKCGTSHQLLKVAYEKAWTTFWWFEDYSRFNELYTKVESRATGSRNIRDLELLCNLWMILRPIPGRSDLDSEALHLQERTEQLKSELERLEAEGGQSTSLWAQSLLLHMKLLMASPEEQEDLLGDFEEVILKAEGLVGFPLEKLIQILEELGEIMGNRESYDELYETVIQVSSRRDEEVSTARMLYRRGKQQLGENPYSAIRFFGRSLSRLYKHESRHDLVRALYWCASAYEKVGLLWAARGSLVTAAAVAANELHRYGDVNLQQYLCLKHLRRIELRLGRMGYALSWHDAAETLASALVEQGHDEGAFLRDAEIFDQLFGAQLLRIDFHTLGRLEQLPQALHELGLPLSSMALLYSLGHEVELDLEKLEDIEDTREYFLSWKDGLSGADSPPEPQPHDRRKIELQSTVLGCTIHAEVVNDRSAITFAESLLASLESFLATGPVDEIGAQEPEMWIEIKPSEFTKDPFKFELENSQGRPYLSVVLKKKDLQTLTMEEQDRIKEKMNELVVLVTTRITIVGDPNVLTENLCVDERGLERSVHFTTSLVTTRNVLGENWKYRVSSFSSEDLERYELRRDTPWDAGEPVPDESSEYAFEDELELAGPDTPIPDDLAGPQQIKHSNIEVDNLIRPALWDKASWFGTAFLTDKQETLPPLMAPIFEDLDAAKKIFSLLHQEIGEVDDEDELRVTIVRGIDRTRPQDYRVVFRPKTVRPMTKERFGTLMGRICTMEPSSKENLNRFLSSFERTGRYVLAPATAQSRQANVPEVSGPSIGKQDLHVREAYEIGPRDPDSMAIEQSDRPVIPEEIEDAPVLSMINESNPTD